ADRRPGAVRDLPGDQADEDRGGEGRCTRDDLERQVAEADAPPLEGAARHIRRQLQLALDLLDRLLRDDEHRLRDRLEEQLRPVGLPLRDRPEEELPEVGGLRAVRRDDHVRVGGDRIRERELLRRIDDREGVRRVRLLVARGRREDALEARRRVLAGLVLHREVAQVVVERVGDVDVADRAGRLRDAACDAGAAALPGADGPVDGDAGAVLRLPRRARGRQEVGEVVGRARVVRAVDDRDLRARQADALVQPLDRRIVPLRDLAYEDLRQGCAVHVQQVLHAGQVVDDGGRGERPRDLNASLAGRELIRRERRVARAEVDRAVRHGGDAGTGADAAVLELVPVRGAERGRPLLDERLHERAARTGDRDAAALRRG